jgi:hypothetical protein
MPDMVKVVVGIRVVVVIDVIGGAAVKIFIKMCAYSHSIGH